MNNDQKIIRMQQQEIKRVSSMKNNVEAEQLRNVAVAVERYLAKQSREIFGFGHNKTKDNIEYSWPVRDEWRAKLLKAIRDYDERNS